MGRLVYGVGTYSRGKFRASKNNKHTKVYRAWLNMLKRCYSEETQRTQPTYKGCTVCKEWLDFQNFAEWYSLNSDGDENLFIDKDLLSGDSKIYSPETCLLVTRTVNNFLLASGKTRGRFLIGVAWSKQHGKFMSQCRNSITGKNNHLGLYVNEVDAHLAWVRRKVEIGRLIAKEQKSEKVKSALLAWCDKLETNSINNR